MSRGIVCERNAARSRDVGTAFVIKTVEEGDSLALVNGVFYPRGEKKIVKRVIFKAQPQWVPSPVARHRKEREPAQDRAGLKRRRGF